jgi:hypothetical protein
MCLAGIDGDYYLNTTTGDIFQKQSGVWVKIGNLKGNTGDTGPKGDTGDTGPTGAAGTQWYSGAGDPT